MERLLGMQRIVENWRTFMVEEKMADMNEDKNLVGKIVKLPRGLFAANKGKVLSFDGESYEIEITDKRDRTSVITVGRTAIKEEKKMMVSVRKRFEGDIGMFSINDVLINLNEKIKNRSFAHRKETATTTK